MEKHMKVQKKRRVLNADCMSSVEEGCKKLKLVSENEIPVERGEATGLKMDSSSVTKLNGAKSVAVGTREAHDSKVAELSNTIANLQADIEKKSAMCDFYVTRIDELKHKVAQSEDVRASGKFPVDWCPNGQKGGDQSHQEILTQNQKLKDEVRRLKSSLDVTNFQMDLEIQKKEEAILELSNLTAQNDAANSELTTLRSQKQQFDESKTELTTLRSQKQKFDESKTELAALRNLHSMFEDFETGTDELAALRAQIKSYEAAEGELKELYRHTPIEGNVLKAAAAEIRDMRKQKETFLSASEERNALNSKLQVVTEEVSTLQKEKADLEGSANELAALRKQRCVYETTAAEFKELRGQKQLWESERVELKSLRAQNPTLSRPSVEAEASRRREIGTKEFQAMAAKVYRLEKIKSKLLNIVRYWEAKELVDKKNFAAQDIELESARIKERENASVVDAVEAKLRSAEKERRSYEEERNVLVGEKKILKDAFERVMSEHRNMEQRLHTTSEENRGLQTEVENTLKSRIALQVDSTSLNRELFLKEAKIESLKAELKHRESKEESIIELLEEVATLRRSNRAYMNERCELKEELSLVLKQLGDATSTNLCLSCRRNKRDTVLIPCTHMHCCLKCVRELVQKDKCCPTCDKGISGFVHSIPSV